MYPPRKTTIAKAFDLNFARTNNAKRAELIYAKLERSKYAAFGRELPAGGIYYDSTYGGGDSNGTIEKPFVNLENVTFNVPGQVVNFKRGSTFFITSERYQTCLVTAPNVTFRSYGDETLPPPLITGLKEVTGFTEAAGEYSANFPLALGQNCMAIAYGDNLASVIVLGTAGSLAAGQAAFSANKIYMKDNPGTRKVYASAAGSALVVRASGFRMDGVNVGYTSNNAIGLIAPNGTTITDIIMRDVGTMWGGNNGISGSNATGVRLIRTRDDGSYNNAISGIDDDSDWIILEAVCYGRTRKAGEFIVSKPGVGGYYNDGITAHGFGLGAWIVMGCVIANVRENGIDIIGGLSAGGMDVHKDSIIQFNRIDSTGEAGVLMWAYGTKALGNYITNCGQDGLRVGDSAQVRSIMNQEIAYNFIMGCGTRSDLGYASGVGVVWGGAWVHHNTIVVTAAANRTATGNMNINSSTGIPTLRYENNLFVLERDGLGIVQMNSSSVDKTKFSFKGNVYIYPPGNTTAPFPTGGSLRTFAQWLADIEASARSFVDTASAGISGPTYAPNIDSPIAASLAYSAPGLDLNARFAAGCVGASAVAEA